MIFTGSSNNGFLVEEMGVGGEVAEDFLAALGVRAGPVREHAVGEVGAPEGGDHALWEGMFGAEEAPVEGGGGVVWDSETLELDCCGEGV